MPILVPSKFDSSSKRLAAALGGRAMMRVAARGRTRDRRIAALANQLGAARPLRQLATTVAPAAAAAAAPVEKMRSEYAAPEFLVPKIGLRFLLGTGEEPTAVFSKLEVLRQSSDAQTTLKLDGEDLLLQTVSVNGNALVEGQDYHVGEEQLTIHAPVLPAGPSPFTVETHVHLKPHENFQLSGLYKSSGMFCTQCEAEGFRRITYMMDRPDVMSVYTVRVEADWAANPILLSNGNLVAEGAVEGAPGFHYTVSHSACQPLLSLPLSLCLCVSVSLCLLLCLCLSLAALSWVCLYWCWRWR